MTARLLLRGARRLDGSAADPVLIANGRIAAIGPEAGAERDARAVDLDGLRVAPGFIDLQVNGACGRDFTTDPAAMWEVGAELARYGVTAFLPTIVSAPPNAVDAALEAWASGPPSIAAQAGAQPIGLHLEGPYLATSRRGAHGADHLRAPNPAEVAGWSGARGVRLVTLAPELPGATALIEGLVGRGVVVSLGHSEADAATARSGVEAGARYVTHTFNAMSGLDHRRPGLAAVALLDERLTLGLIADGHHVAPELLALAWRAAGAGRISLVTDAIAALGKPAGRYALGDAVVDVDAGSARLADGTLAGAVAPLDRCLRNFAEASGCGLAAAVESVTAVAARLLELGDGRGRLEPGGRADLAVLTDAGTVVATLVAGSVAFAAEPDRWA